MDVAILLGNIIIYKQIPLKNVLKEITHYEKKCSHYAENNTSVFFNKANLLTTFVNIETMIFNKDFRTNFIFTTNHKAVKSDADIATINVL